MTVAQSRANKCKDRFSASFETGSFWFSQYHAGGRWLSKRLLLCLRQRTKKMTPKVSYSKTGGQGNAIQNMYCIDHVFLRCLELSTINLQFSLNFRS